jgi:hypothetical protein
MNCYCKKKRPVKSTSSNFHAKFFKGSCMSSRGTAATQLMKHLILEAATKSKSKL